MTAMHLMSWAMTHAGMQRRHNEDAHVDRLDRGLRAVADGAGGHQAGEVASGMIRESLDAIPPGLSASEPLTKVRLRIEPTHTALRDPAMRRGPSITVASTVMVLTARGEHFACLRAGDSRACLRLDGVMQQITHDHSLVQQLVDSGAIRPEEADGHPRANMITRAVGADLDEFAPHKISGRLKPGERCLLCSDGLVETLPDSQLAALPGAQNGVPPPQTLIAAALAMNASANVTAVMAEAP